MSAFLAIKYLFLPHLVLLGFIYFRSTVVVVEFFEDVVVEITEIIGLREGALYECTLGFGQFRAGWYRTLGLLRLRGLCTRYIQLCPKVCDAQIIQIAVILRGNCDRRTGFGARFHDSLRLRAGHCGRFLRLLDGLRGRGRGIIHLRCNLRRGFHFNRCLLLLCRRYLHIVRFAVLTVYGYILPGTVSLAVPVTIRTVSSARIPAAGVSSVRTPGVCIPIARIPGARIPAGAASGSISASTCTIRIPPGAVSAAAARGPAAGRPAPFSKHFVLGCVLDDGLLLAEEAGEEAGGLVLACDNVLDVGVAFDGFAGLRLHLVDGGLVAFVVRDDEEGVAFALRDVITEMHHDDEIQRILPDLIIFDEFHRCIAVQDGLGFDEGHLRALRAEEDFHLIILREFQYAVQAGGTHILKIYV